MSRVVEKLILVVIFLFIGVYCDDSSMLKYLQPNDIDSGKHDNMKEAARHICTRECKHGDTRTCYYRFTVETYTTMGGACGNCHNTSSDCDGKQCVQADCYERSILCINRRMPAPSIQVCKGDHVIVDVKNMMAARTIAIHWHGLRQICSPYMDGVPMVTQCPIMEGQIFRYHYKADYPGLHFYHSHGGLQKVDGIVGSLVIRQPKDCEPNRDQYDYDLPSMVLVIQDWKHECADCLWPGSLARDRDQEADTYLIQGKNKFINGTCRLYNITVVQWKRYMVRIIAGTCFACQYVITVEKHWFIIIGTDGQPTKPYKVKSLTMSPGERFTVVIVCDQPVGTYWIHVRGLGACANKSQALALLIYSGHNGNPSSPEPGPSVVDVPGVNDQFPTVNPINVNCSEESRKEKGPCICHLQGAKETPENLKGKCHKRMVLSVGFVRFNNSKPYTNSTTHEYPKFVIPGAFGLFAGTINGYTYSVSPCPLLTQLKDVPRHLFCPDYDDDLSDIATWNNEYRECINVIKIPSYSCVEFLFVDADTRINHPFHLHGFDYCVTLIGKLPNGTTFADKMKTLLQQLDKRTEPVPECCPYKDTLMVPASGYALVRIFTDNPGMWYFHCHFAYHLDAGMAAVIQVGHPSEFQPPPKGFPRCCDYLPLQEDCEDDCHFNSDYDTCNYKACKDTCPYNSNKF